MAMTLLLSTTGTDVYISTLYDPSNGVSGITFSHPTTNFDLLNIYTLEEIRDASSELESNISGGDITILDSNGYTFSTVETIGIGDMYRGVFDTDNNDIVDSSTNADNLNGFNGPYYLDLINSTGTLPPGAAPVDSVNGATGIVNLNLENLGDVNLSGATNGYVLELNNGTWEANLVVGITGPQGIQGEIGPTGSQGIQGEIGPTGSQGIQGEIGPTGSQGIQGEVGATGPQGPLGDTVDQVYFRGISNNTSNYNTGTPTSIPWNGTNIKSSIIHSTVTNPERVEVPEDGIYDIYASFYWTSSAQRSQIKLTVWVNGVQQTLVGEGQGGYARNSGGSNLAMSNISTLLNLSGGDYIEIRAEQDGVAGTTAQLANKSTFTIHKLAGTRGQIGPTGPSGGPIGPIGPTGPAGASGSVTLDGGGYFMIWAEENSTLGNDTYEWAYGNGADTPQNGGIVIGVDCYLYSLGLKCNTTGTSTVRLEINGVDSGASVTAVAGKGLNIISPQIAVSAGDWINFKTVLSNITSSPNQVVASFITDGVIGATGPQGATGPDGLVLVESVNGQTGSVTLDTDDISEGSNLYYTDVRARNSISSGVGITYSPSTGIIQLNATTDNVTEGSNLYYTDSRARLSITGATGINYNSTSGVIEVNNATTAEINTGTEDGKLINPDQLEGSKYLNQSGSKISAVASGTDTYTATISPAITSYEDTQSFHINFTNANTGSSTLNLNGLGAKNLYKGVTNSVIEGDILDGQILEVAYDGTNFQILSSAGIPGVITGALIFGGLISPPTLTGNVNDYNPTGLSTTSFIRLDGGVSIRSVSGIQAPTPAVSQALYIVNIGGANIRFFENNASSLAPNRILSNGTVLLNPDESILLVYDTADSRWRVASVYN
ncbi:MAG: triple helix repeat-containing collagen [uncultured marine phage]|uniref:Triple helix repeat-containing collagen n=1 Tax=uncultured marine phage TaxID=707152 RepID=A0A8D9FR71_9VIRU|nr:MAG: triple helix repeat-containing collagen [uncultured marine phage]